MSKDLTKKINAITIQESIDSEGIRIEHYLNAVKGPKVPDTDEILADKENYKEIIDEKGEVKAQFIIAGLWVDAGKTGDKYYHLGKSLYYIDEKKKWHELGGFKNRDDFLEKNPKFPYRKTYCSNAVQVYKLVLYGRLTRDDIIALGNKITLLADYMIKDLTDNQVMKLIKYMAKHTPEECRIFLRSGDYRYYLDGETPPSETKEIPLIKKGRAWEHIQVNFNFPKFKVNRDKLEQKFETDWEAQVYALALRKCKPVIEREIESIFNDPSHERYRKLALKKYKS